MTRFYTAVLGGLGLAGALVLGVIYGAARTVLSDEDPAADLGEAA